jgi:hypothetical protein
MRGNIHDPAIQGFTWRGEDFQAFRKVMPSEGVRFDNKNTESDKKFGAYLEQNTPSDLIKALQDCILR